MFSKTDWLGRTAESTDICCDVSTLNGIYGKILKMKKENKYKVTEIEEQAGKSGSGSSRTHREQIAKY